MNVCLNEKEYAKEAKENLFPLMRGKKNFEGCVFEINGTKDDGIRWVRIGS